MTTIEYLSLPLYKRIIHRIINFFVSIPKVIGRFFGKVIPQVFTKIWRSISLYFINLYNYGKIKNATEKYNVIL